jgi:hypothetical protein
MQTEHDEATVEFILDLEDQLEEAGQISANRAFNLGCWIGLVPAGVLITLIFFLSEGSWVVTLVSAVMIMISLIALANLAAFLAKSRSMNRRYDDQIKPQIGIKLEEFELTDDEFNQIMIDMLPKDSALRKLRSADVQD